MEDKDEWLIGSKRSRGKIRMAVAGRAAAILI